jgi:heme/copper-type cytochrome/quinol oxidase subunit 3
MAERAIARPGPLPVGPVGRNGVGWNGLVCLVLTEAALFLYLLFAYYYAGATSPPGWVLEAQPKLNLALPNTILLLASSGFAWWGERAVKKGRDGPAALAFVVALLLGIAFATIQGFEWHSKSYGLGASSYASLYYVTTGFHMGHVVAGLIALILLCLWTARGYFGPRRHLFVSNAVLYWHFVDAVWLCVFATYYLTPYLGFGL